jgi:hypothetical protein
MKIADLDQDLLLVNVVYGLVDHTSGGVRSMINDGNYRWDRYSTKCAGGEV